LFAAPDRVVFSGSPVLCYLLEMYGAMESMSIVKMYWRIVDTKAVTYTATPDGCLINSLLAGWKNFASGEELRTTDTHRVFITIWVGRDL